MKKQIGKSQIDRKRYKKQIGVHGISDYIMNEERTIMYGNDVFDGICVARGSKQLKKKVKQE